MRLARCLVFLAVALAPGTAWAQISLSITTTTDTVALPDLAVAVTVSNGGKETAHSVRATIQTGATRLTLPGLIDLGPGQSHSFTASIPVPASKPGTYPLFVTIAYADANGYSFSAIAASSYSSGGATASDVVGVLTAMPVSDTGALRLRLKNNTGAARALTLTPVLPLELTPGGLPGSLTLGPGEEHELQGTISNFSALGGSRYPIFIAMEYETADQHFSAVVTTIVEVTAPGTPFSRYQGWLIGAGVLLFLAAVWRMTRRRKRVGASRT